ncbi:EAL domain-containing protein [Dapis sp. BLCC M172]|uniref:two-component system response regulator n=1 Tax=Dapis sp. BLCC M172 TaxID=2975281 RepID=UPI003CED3469
MGSCIQVQSQPGVGSIFSFEIDLPLAQEWVKTCQSDRCGEIIGIKGAAPTVLVIDDKFENRSLLIKLLQPIGFKVIEANDGEEGWQKIQMFNPQLVITDLLMPIMDGFELIKQIRASEIYPDVAIIATSASVFETDQDKSLSVGANDFLPKPFTTEDLFLKIRQLLNLEWEYEEMNDSLAKVADENEEIIVPPPIKTLDKFYELAMKGNLKGIIRKAQSLEQQNKNFIPNLEQKVIQGNTKLEQATAELHETQAKLLQREVKLQYNSFHDPLTGLPNKVRFLGQLDQTIEFSLNHNYHYALLLLDIDRFKLINDSLGYSKGDILLQEIAIRLQNSIGVNNLLARLSSDEFVILLEGIENPSEATELAERIQQEYLQYPYELDGYQIFVKASIGITYSFFGYHNSTDLFRDANIAMQKAKDYGKTGYAVFEPKMQVDVLQRLNWENELRQAIKKQELFLHYQPIINLVNNSLKGFEALVRWNHSSCGQVSPGKFIPIAEKTRLIHDIGWWVLEAACQQLNSWQQHFPEFQSLVLNVNLSPPQLTAVDFIQQLKIILEQNNISGENLKLEITESCLLEGVEHRDKIFNQIKDLGVKLCIDDFGTGYSSLSRLYEFPIDTLKIDRAFVKRIEPSSDNITIAAIITLAKSLNMDIVAEGIETPLQRDKLKDMGCELGQGFLFARPLEYQAATRIIQDFNGQSK